LILTLSLEDRLREIAERIVKTCLNISKEDIVCVVSDTNKVRIAEALAYASRKVAGETIVLVMNPRRVHSEELPKPVSSAMREATVIIAPTTYAITHTEGFREALKKGARGLILRGVDEDMMLHGAINADYEMIRRNSEVLKTALENSSEVFITTKHGTNMRLVIRGRPVFTLVGIATEPGTFAAMPDGEVPLSPVEGSSEGVMVFDHTLDGIGKLREPVRNIVKNGRVISIQGGEEARRFRELLEEAGECAYNIAEFAIGTNPSARVIGNMAEDKKREGSVHIAVGDSKTLGGEVSCNLHLDGLMLEPTIQLDDLKICIDGKLDWDKVREKARR